MRSLEPPDQPLLPVWRESNSESSGSQWPERRHEDWGTSKDVSRPGSNPGLRDRPFSKLLSRFETGQSFGCSGFLWALAYTFERESSEVSCLLLGLEDADCCRFRAGMPSHDHWCVPLCTNRQFRCTNLSFHTICWRRKIWITSRFCQRCCLQQSLLAYRLPALDKVWRGRGGLSSVLARRGGLDPGGSSASLSVQAKAGRAPVAWPTSTRT